jgi:hypothetical protein
MAPAEPDTWPDLLRRTLASYDEPLLRRVATRLVRPRNQWPAEELIERSVSTAANAPMIDRRLKDLEPAGRQLLALIGHSRQPRWSLGNLVELALALGHPDGLQPVFALLEAGLLFPLLPGAEAGPGKAAGDGAPAGRIKTFEQWLGAGAHNGPAVFCPPQIAARAVGEDLGLPDLSRPEEGDEEVAPFAPLGAPQEADGLEWLLRVAVLWQQVSAAPLRRTQQGGFFKRDAERLGQDPLLNGPPADRLADVPDLGFLVAAWAEAEGVLRPAEGELRAGPLPAAWERGLAAALESLYADLPRLHTWNALAGWRGDGGPAGNPFPSAYLLTLLLLARLPDGAFVRPAALEAWVTARHPYWAGESMRPSRRKPWAEAFLLGVAYHLRLVQVARNADSDWGVRLAQAGRWLLGLAEASALETAFPQTLLVQPNLEILAYRQGLSPDLIARLTRCAAWKSLGAACTLQLGPESVYRALESGETFETIRRTLERHGTRALPPAVLDSLRTWADKRDRITVYPSATLLEFASAAELDEALARGLPAVRVADTLAVVASEDAIDFRHFRLTGTRDYALPPEKCVTVEPDGVTLTVDPGKADLMLDTELPRFAEPLPAAAGRRQYRMTPATLAAAREAGLGVPALEAWFRQRAGQPLSDAARLLLTAPQVPPPRLQRHLVLHVDSEETADGLMQWPATRALVEERLGPTALAVAEGNVAALRERLKAAGIAVAE